MKKLFSVLLILALLAGIAGCGSNPEKETFYNDLHDFQLLVQQNNNEIYAACVHEHKYMMDNNITKAAEDNRAEIALNSFYLNESPDIDTITARMDEIHQLYETITANKWAKEKAGSTVDLTGAAWSSLHSMFGLMLQPEGTPGEFKEKYNDFTDQIDDQIDEINAFLNQK